MTSELPRARRHRASLSRVLACAALACAALASTTVGVALAEPLSARGAAIHRERMHRSGAAARGTYHNRADRARWEEMMLARKKSEQIPGGHAVAPKSEEEPAEEEAEEEEEEEEKEDEKKDEEEEEKEEKKDYSATQ